MPNANAINPALIRAIFLYDPDTGELTPRPTATLVATAIPVARRTDARQWEVGKHRYSLHRLVWAYHNPDNANPRYIVFKDGWHTNSRIENLEAKNVHPRWEGHTKQINVRLGADGSITVVAQKSRSGIGSDADLTHKPIAMTKINNVQALVRQPSAPKVRPDIDTSWADAFETLNPKPKPRNSDGTDYEYQ